MAKEEKIDLGELFSSPWRANVFHHPSSGSEFHRCLQSDVATFSPRGGFLLGRSEGRKGRVRKRVVKGLKEGGVYLIGATMIQDWISQDLYCVMSFLIFVTMV